ncbi:MAG: NAD-dependent epimerase/dehydratase family protein [Bacteroidetes bacterium]|nr:MAG: NAD-dependent epimerase/dehydratase family protein [Bacteroidota bacterium]
MSDQKKKVLLTGVAGFLGSNLLKRLLSEGHEVVGIDNLCMGRIEHLQPYLENPGFTFVQKDIMDPDTFNSLEKDFDIITHLAAFKIPRYGNASATLKVNSKGTEHVLEFAKDFACKTVLASTSDVYGMRPDVPFDEEGVCVIGNSKVPRWAYAVSKLYDEHLGLAYMDDYNFPVSILRFFGSYGPNQHLSWWGGPQSVFIDCLLKGEVIPIHGDGSQTRTFTFVEDTVSGIYASMMKDEANGEIFNIGAHKEMTILDLAHLLHKISGNPGEANVKLIPYDEIQQGKKYQDVMRRVPDTTKAERMLGFRAQFAPEDGLKITYEWQKAVRQAQAQAETV